MKVGRAPVVCVGTLLLDTIALVDRLPGEDERIEADRVVTAGGGNASTSAVTIARLGVDVDFAGTVGDDEVGHLLLAGLADEGVGTSHVRVVAGGETSHSVVIVSQETATRTIITRPAAAPQDLPQGYDWVHVDKSGYAALHEAGGSSSRVSLDDGNPIGDLDLRLIDLYVPTAQVLRARYGTDDLVGASRLALAAGASLVVATDGARGSVAVSPDEVAYAPALAISPVSSLGAGDVFHGALVAALILGKPIPDAIRFANVTAALSCRGVDGRSGIPSRHEVDDALRELPASPADAASAIAALRSAI